MSITNFSKSATAFQFEAFGLRLEANREVPGLTPVMTRAAPEVRVWLDSVPPEFSTRKQTLSDPVIADLEPDESCESWVTVWTHKDFFQLRYTDGTEFFIDRTGAQIWATWPRELTLADTATYLLGPIMNVVLRLRGTISLHASAVRIGDVAVAFVGPEGAGKSTTAASFSKAGYPVLTDDIAAIADGGQTFQIIPAYPRIRLWPESVEMLFGSVDALPRLTPGWEKRYLQLDSVYHRFESEPVPLAAIYFLHPRSADLSTPAIDEEPKRDAMVKLIGNIGGNYILDHVAPATSFDLLQRLAHSVPLRRLVPRSDPDYLAQLRDLVVADVSRLQVKPF